MKPDMRETIARAIHESYRTARATSTNIKDVTMLEWEKLPASLKESNREQADDIFEKLRRIGCTVHKVSRRRVALLTFTKEEIEMMAEMEHARWNSERLREGWKLGKKKDATNKTSPYLVPWAKLPENVREWDRETVRKIPELLAGVGLEVRLLKQVD
jgi:hypothetical protein